MRTWIVQSNLGNSRELRAISAACADLGARCLPVEAIPFDDSPLRLPGDLDPKAVITYGSVGFVQKIHRQLGPAASLYDPESFNTRTYRRRWGSNMLNQPGYSGPLLWLVRGTAGVPESLGDELFVRPASDLKDFAGVVVRRPDLLSWARSLEGTTVSMLDDVEISSVVRIEAEYRLWIVDGVVVAGVAYRAGGRLRDNRLSLSDEETRDLTMTAEACARCWSPARAFVMDLCYVSEGDDRPRIVEAGCLTSAGFYNSSVVQDVVRAVSLMVDRDQEAR